MAPTPFRRKKAAKTIRNLAIAEAALALARDRAHGQRSRGPSGKLLLIGGAVAAIGAVALLKRDKVAGLLPSRSDEPGAAGSPPPQTSSDAPGPVADTATPVPAPDPQEPAAIDEAGPEGEPATAAERPPAEAGEGDEQSGAAPIDDAENRKAPDDEKPGEDEPGDYRTWSGGSVEP